MDGAATYVVLGNCLAAGAEGKRLTTPYPAHFLPDLEQQLGEPLRVCDFSRIFGMTTAELLDLLREDREVRDILHHSRVVTFNIGENELLAAEAAFARGDRTAVYRAWLTFARQYPAVVNLLLRLIPRGQAIIRTFSMYCPLPQHPQAHYVHRFNRVILESTAMGENRDGRPIPAARLDRIFVGPQMAMLLGSDGIHPSAEGHRCIARELAALGTDTV